MPQHTEICSLLPLAFSLLGRILTHDCHNMSNETLRHLAIMYVKKMDKKRKGEVRISNMTAHEMILLCSSLQGVRTCIPLCLNPSFATFAAFGKLGTLHLRLEACRSMSQHSKIFLGTVGA